MKSKLFLLVVTFLAAAVAAIIYQQNEIARLKGLLPSERAAGALSKSTKNTIGAKNTAADTPAGRLAQLLAILNHSGRTPSEIMQEMARFIDRVPPGEIPSLLDAVKDLPRSNTLALAKSVLISKWADNDLAGALAWAKGERNSSDRDNDIRAVFDAWASKDLAGALAGVAQVADARTRSAIVSALLARLADTDPAAALNAMLKLPLGQRTPALYATIFSSWAKSDPAAASAAAAKLPPSVARDHVLTAIAAAWSSADPQAALAWANKLPPGASRTAAMSTILDTLASTDPESASAFVNELPKGATRNSLITSFASEWAATDPEAAFAWVNNVSNGQIHDRAVLGILNQIGQSNPAAEAEFLTKVGDISIRDMALPQLATTWAQTDIKGALAWAQSLFTSEGDTRASVFQNVLKSWASSDPESAAAFAVTTRGDPNYRAIIDGVAQSWSAADPQGALAWAQNIEPAGVKGNAVRSILTNLAQVDPKAAWDTVQAMPEDGSGIRTKIMSNIIPAWTRQDPAAVAELLDVLPGNIMYSTYAQVASSWITQDPEAASQWINTLPKGSNRDNAVLQLITIEGKNDLPSAFQWGVSMQSTGMSQMALHDVVMNWANRDPAATSAAIDSANIPDSERTFLNTVLANTNTGWVRANRPDLVPLHTDSPSP